MINEFKLTQAGDNRFALLAKSKGLAFVLDDRTQVFDKLSLEKYSYMLNESSPVGSRQQEPGFSVFVPCQYFRFSFCNWALIFIVTFFLTSLLTVLFVNVPIPGLGVSGIGLFLRAAMEMVEVGQGASLATGLIEWFNGFWYFRFLLVALCYVIILRLTGFIPSWFRRRFF